MNILENFGIKPVFLLAQVVNFVLLLLILKRFLYKPILKVLEDRKQKIAESLKNVEEIDKRLARIAETREENLRQTASESEKIIKEATIVASQIVVEAHQKASSDIQKMMQKATEQNNLEREKMRQELRGELADLVALSLKTITGKILNFKDQKNILEKSLKELN